MTIPVFLGILTLSPAIGGLIILALGLARRAMPALALGIAALGALIPAICLLFLTPYLASGDPLFATLFGGSIAPNAWFSAAYRVDAFGLYAAFGVTFLVTPLLLWLGWRGAAAPGDGETSSRAQWGGVALALGIETAGLTVLFADNILWLSLAWLVLVALIWGLGEIGNDVETLDRMGLVLTLVGPVVWAAILLLPALGKPIPQVIYPRLTDMMGRGGMPWLQVVGLAVAFAFATGAYPFTAWVRRRAALVTPAGLAALVLALVPVAIFVGARTYSAIQDADNLWPHQQQVAGSTAPPITVGIAFVVLGALTLGVSGLLALGRNDARGLLAYLAVAQGGWGLIALGIGEPESVLGVPLLLATTVFGGGAAIAALFSGGTLTSDIEPEGAGPRAVGMPMRPLHLAAWSIGVITLVGAPLFGGFVSRQLVSAGALHARGLPVPLMGIAWAGDVLLALALLRATAPAFATLFGAPAQAIEKPVSSAEAVEVSAPEAVSTPVALASDESDEQDARDEESSTDDGRPEAASNAPASLGVRWLPELPAAIFALLALVVGIAPQALLSFGATRAAAALLQPATLDATLKVSLVGYSAGTASWLPSIAWLVIVLVGALLAFLLPSGTREVRPIVLSGRRVEPTEAATMFAPPSPVEAWGDLAPALRSEVALPGSRWLLNGTEDGDADGDAAEERQQDDGADAPDEDALDVEWVHEQVEASPSGQMPFSGAESEGADDAQHDADFAEAEAEDGEPLDTPPSTPDARRNGSGAFVTAQRGSRNGKARKSGNNQRSRGGRA
ncbi:MAG: proton-conducting transporter transmembrane domain-containing protein [Ktedonobacterales bacterium]